MAQNVSNKNILLYGSAWSAPGWMKSNNQVYGQGYLLPEYYQVWADYHLRFLNAYKVYRKLSNIKIYVYLRKMVSTCGVLQHKMSL